MTAREGENNAWDEPPAPEDPDDEYNVPESERKDEDQDVGNYALGTTGDNQPSIDAERAAYERALRDVEDQDEIDEIIEGEDDEPEPTPHEEEE